MSIIILGDSFTFPEGDAATNRVHTYAKGFCENGINVHVICFRSSYNNSVGTGQNEGIKYYYPFGDVKRNKYFIVRSWYKFLKYLRTMLLIKRINEEDKIAVVIVYTMSFIVHLFSWIISRMNKSKLVKECGEHPLRLHQKNVLKRRQGLIKLYIESRLSDVIFCISQYLVNLYLEKGIAQDKLFLVPSTVDPTRFVKTEKKPLPYPYIGYFGGLTFDRDNVDALIRAFDRIRIRYPDLHLVLGGFCSEPERRQIEDLIQNLELNSKVVLLRYLSRDEIIRYIVHAKILVLVRSIGIASQASFPSKLTEYLATAVPVVSVSVGEIPNYLIDGVNSFLVEPENYDELFQKLNFALANYEEALEIGKKGEELTATTFNYNYQAKRIIQFINGL